MSDFKDMMIWRDEHGFDGSYEATRDALADSVDLLRKQLRECECGSCDCDPGDECDCGCAA